MRVCVYLNECACTLCQNMWICAHICFYSVEILQRIFVDIHTHTAVPPHVPQGERRLPEDTELGFNGRRRTVFEIQETEKMFRPAEEVSQGLAPGSRDSRKKLEDLTDAVNNSD